MCLDFQKTLLEDVLTEYQELINSIREHNQIIEDVVENVNEQLGNFEHKVGEMKVSDQDHFFLNKEILRFKTAINSVDSQREIYIEHVDLVEN